MIEIQVQTHEQATIVQLVGDVDAQTAPQMREQIAAQIHDCPSGGIALLLDMTGVEYMSSAGLRVLLGIYRQVQRSQGRVVLAGLSPELQDVMSMTGFSRFFTLCETVEQGLAALE